jgi:hypothetical protein
MDMAGLFERLFGGKAEPPAGGVQAAKLGAQKYVEYQKLSARGGLATSGKYVAVMTLNNDLRLFLEQNLEPVVTAKGWDYSDNVSVEGAVSAQVVILDVTPYSDARLHDQYDKILRLKKSMGKSRNDTFCVIGRRDDHKRYPRGTYPSLWFFCIKEDDMMHRDADLPPEGRPTVVGPLLFNFADIVTAIEGRLTQ